MATMVAYLPIVSAAIVAIVAIVGFSFLWRASSPERPDSPAHHSNGRVPGRWPPLGPPDTVTYGDAQLAHPERHSRSMSPILGGDRGIWFGQILGSEREAAYVGDRHLLTIAPNRTGKSSCTIIPNLVTNEWNSIICIDPKGQNAAVTARARRRVGPVYCINPFGEHAGPPWCLPRHSFNPLAGMDIESPNVEADVAALADALIVTESQTQPYFDNSARDLTEVLILHALATHRGSATLLDMRKWLSLPVTAREGEPSLLRVIVDMTHSDYSFIREMAGRFLSSARSVDEIVQAASNQTKFLSHRVVKDALSGHDFSMDVFKNEIATLYVIFPERYLDAYARFLRLIVTSALNGLHRTPGGIRTILMMDEFARLGHLAAIEQAVGASAGYNVQLWPFVQDINQLQHLYPNRWDSFIANAGVVQWFTPNDASTAEYLSKRIGKTTVLESSHNDSSSHTIQQNNHGGPSHSGTRGGSTNEKEIGVDFLTPQDLYNMPASVQLLTLAGLKYPICCRREAYFNPNTGILPYRGELLDPDPFHPDSVLASPGTRASG